MPLTAPAPIETERLRIRQLRDSDLPEWFELNGDVEVHRYLTSTPWKELQEAEAWFQRVAKLQTSGKGLMFAIALRETDRIIGTCTVFALEEENAHAELGYILGRPHWGQGLMKEALTAFIDCVFWTMPIHRLEAQLDARNTTSSRLLQRLGFERDGILRERWTTRGVVSDVEVYSRLRSEWDHRE